MNKIEETRNCTACKIDRPLSHYVSKAGRTNLKNCQRCRKLKTPKKCLHGRQKIQCKECKGTAICVHDKRKAQCKECKGSSICVHDKIKTQCKDCSDPQMVTIKTMLKGAKLSDIKKNRYNANHFIDKCFIEQLMDESMDCHYCKTTMQLINYDKTLCTIERLNNSIGHIKSNCVLACLDCNSKHKN